MTVQFYQQEDQLHIHRRRDLISSIFSFLTCKFEKIVMISKKENTFLLNLVSPQLFVSIDNQHFFVNLILFGGGGGQPTLKKCPFLILPICKLVQSSVLNS